MTFRDLAEVRRAHDLLAMIGQGDVAPPLELLEDPLLLMQVLVAGEALCWVLGHDGDRSFEEFLEAVEACLRKAGYELSSISEGTLAVQ